MAEEHLRVGVDEQLLSAAESVARMPTSMATALAALSLAQLKRRQDQLRDRLADQQGRSAPRRSSPLDGHVPAHAAPSSSKRRWPKRRLPASSSPTSPSGQLLPPVPGMVNLTVAAAPSFPTPVAASAPASAPAPPSHLLSLSLPLHTAHTASAAPVPPAAKALSQLCNSRHLLNKSKLRFQAHDLRLYRKAKRIWEIDRNRLQIARRAWGRWDAFVRAAHAARDHAMQQNSLVQKFRSRVSHAAFRAWRDVVQQNAKLKAFMRHHMANAEQKCFDMWRSFIKDIRDERQAMVKRFLYRMQNKAVYNCFHGFIINVKQNAIMRRFVKAMQNRCVVTTFDAWIYLVERNRRVRIWTQGRWYKRWLALWQRVRDRKAKIVSDFAFRMQHRHLISAFASIVHFRFLCHQARRMQALVRGHLARLADDVVRAQERHVEDQRQADEDRYAAAFVDEGRRIVRTFLVDPDGIKTVARLARKLRSHERKKRYRGAGGGATIGPSSGNAQAVFELFAASEPASASTAAVALGAGSVAATGHVDDELEVDEQKGSPAPRKSATPIGSGDMAGATTAAAASVGAATAGGGRGRGRGRGRTGHAVGIVAAAAGEPQADTGAGVGAAATEQATAGPLIGVNRDTLEALLVSALAIPIPEDVLDHAFALVMHGTNWRKNAGRIGCHEFCRIVHYVDQHQSFIQRLRRYLFTKRDYAGEQSRSRRAVTAKVEALVARNARSLFRHTRPCAQECATCGAAFRFLADLWEHQSTCKAEDETFLEKGAGTIVTKNDLTSTKRFRVEGVSELALPR